MARIKQTTRRYNLIDRFPHGYRNREDQTNLPPGVLVSGSKNVLTNVSERVQTRKGYTLDGAASTDGNPIYSSFDWNNHYGTEKHLRAGFLSSAANDGKLQFRFINSAGTVSWEDLMTSLTSVSLNFCTYWNTTELIREAMWVDGSSNIYRWSGGVTTFASATSDTITKEGTESWSELGFYASADKKIMLGGVEYTYTGGETTTTLTGVTPDPTSGGHSAGDVAYQKVVTTANISTTGLPSTFNNALIANIYGYIYIGSLSNSIVYQSKVNDYTDFSYTSGVRVTGDGEEYNLDDSPIGFAVLDDVLHISAGNNHWYKVQTNLAADLSGETREVKRLKTSSNQGAISQAAISNIRNSVVFISKEPSLESLGSVENIEGNQATNLSDPIKLDFDSYDFTDASVFYYRNYIYLSVPKEGLVLMYNLVTKYWEAPQTLPISRFAIIDGELYGHSYHTGETYKLFDGYNDNGFPMEAIAKFSYNNYGQPADLKNLDEEYLEGYIVPNTTIEMNVKFELDSCATEYTKTLSGDNQQFVCLTESSASLGKNPLGKNPLGGDSVIVSEEQYSKFRWFPTFARKDFYEEQITISSNGEDNYWEIIRFGSNATNAGKRNVANKD
jgi:hypothetical protein